MYFNIFVFPAYEPANLIGLIVGLLYSFRLMNDLYN
jgi:hypothetical protein